MKTKAIGLFMLWALINLTGGKAFATEPSPIPTPPPVTTPEPEFNCQDKVIVEQIPATNWANLNKVIPKHLIFIAEHLKNGNISSAGPLVSEHGQPLGGVAIYTLSDKKKVEAIAKTDPLITEGVSTLVIKPWVECVLK